jgi:uncharacterized membrane protein
VVEIKFGKHVLIFSAISFSLNFIWEWLQCEPYFIHRGTQANPLSMVKAPLGDVILSFIVLGFAVLLDRTEIKKRLISYKAFILLETCAFFVAVIVEKLALVSGGWAYTEKNPLVPFLKVSLLPIFQLLILIPVSLLIIELLNRLQKEGSYGK